jgi:hypothetical protein
MALPAVSRLKTGEQVFAAACNALRGCHCIRGAADSRPAVGKQQPRFLSGQFALYWLASFSISA